MNVHEFSDSDNSEEFESVPDRNKLKNYRAQIEMLQQQVNDRQEMIIKRDAKIKELETNLSGANQKLSKVKERELKLQTELAKRYVRIKELNAKMADAIIADKLPHNPFERHQEEEINDLHKQIKTITDERDTHKEKRADAEAANENLLDTIRIQQSRIDRFQAALKESVDDNEKMKEQITEVVMNCEKQMAQIQELETTLNLSDKNCEERMKELERAPEPTYLYMELGKLYIELQEAKKPQEAVTAQLAAKEKEIEYLTKKHEVKLAAKDSEIQNLKEIIKEGEEKKKRLMTTITNLQHKIKVYDSEKAEIKATTLEKPFSIRPGMNFGYGDPDEEW